MESERFVNFLIAALAACVVVVIGLIVRRSVQSHSSSKPPLVQRVPHWDFYTEGGHVWGSPGARITIVEFGDFQCPYCRQMDEALRRLRHAYPSDVRVVFRDFPLSAIHPLALAAAKAAECAGAQGAFAPFHDLLFKWQDSIGTWTWNDFAQEAEVPNLATFAQCVRSPTVPPRLRADIAAGQRMGVMGTPTVAVNGVRFIQTPSFALLDSIVRAVLVR